MAPMELAAWRSNPTESLIRDEVVYTGVITMDLAKLNSITKYPSILTYHAMGEKGILKNEVQVPFDGPAILTEKIDGINSRIIMLPNGLYIIGSRDELLYAKGDLIGNNQLGIVDVLKSVAEKLKPSNVLTVYYLEVYGGNIGKNARQYTGSKAVGTMLFDVVKIPIYDEIMKLPIEQIASWRDNGGQQFLSEDNLLFTSSMSIVPDLGIDAIPTDIKETYKWMKSVISLTYAHLDYGAMGKPEGIVARTPDRSKIAKLRFEDYERTFRADDPDFGRVPVR